MVLGFLPAGFIFGIWVGFTGGFFLDSQNLDRDANIKTRIVLSIPWAHLKHTMSTKQLHLRLMLEMTVSGIDGGWASVEICELLRWNSPRDIWMTK